MNPNSRTIITDKDQILKIIKKRRNKRRFRVFHTKGIKCVQCGVEINKILFWTDPYGNQSVDFIHEFPDKSFVFMTVDHIYPLSLGGVRSIENEQPMCSKCNNLKGNQPQLLVEKDLTN